MSTDDKSMKNYPALKELPGPVVQLVASLTAGVGSSILFHTFVKIVHEICSMVILLQFVVSYKQIYMHEVLVNRIVKLAQEKVWLGELTIST